MSNKEEKTEKQPYLLQDEKLSEYEKQTITKTIVSPKDVEDAELYVQRVGGNLGKITEVKK